MINLNGMLTCLGLFYAYKLEDCIHHTFIFTLLVVVVFFGLMAYQPLWVI